MAPSAPWRQRRQKGQNGKKQRFDKTFKVQAVKMVTEKGQKASEVARSLGIHANVLYNWKRKYSQDGDKAFVGKGHLTEMVSLRRKLRDAEIEIEILKKAVGIFSQPEADPPMAEKTIENGSGL